VAEDNGGSPLPRRVPGTKRGPGTGPLARPALSDSDLKRIRTALDSEQAQASVQPQAPPAEEPATLPRRAPAASKTSEPHAQTARPESRISLLPTRPKKAPKEPPPAVPAPRPSEVTEETSRQPDVTAQPEPTAATATDPRLVPAQRTPAEEREERENRDEEKASPEQETASREEVPAAQKNGQASLEKAQLHRTKALPRRPKPAPPKTPPPRPRPALSRPGPPAAPASPRAPARSPTRGRGRAIITGSAIITLVLLSTGSAFLLTRHAGTAKARTGTSAEAAVRDRAAAWVASQVGRTGLVSCDRVMCQALRAHHVPATDLLVLKPGGAGLLRSAVVVVTAAVKKMVGIRLLAADAPAAIAGFSSGPGQISIQVIFPRGAAAYATALRKEIADRKGAGSSLLRQGSVTASTLARQQLQGGQVDSRLLLTLGELTLQGPVYIVSFGGRAPGASPGVPFRSADLLVTGGKADPAPAVQVREMSDFVHQLGTYYASARIRTVRIADGQDAVRIEFTAPGRFGLLSASAQ
jgi:hypothetical protein